MGDIEGVLPSKATGLHIAPLGQKVWEMMYTYKLLSQECKYDCIHFWSETQTLWSTHLVLACRAGAPLVKYE